jgi:hypothetical protein
MMAIVWAHSPYRGEALLLHLALADFANDEGTCFPSQKTLAKKARCSENFVRVAIRRMVKDGFVEILEAAHGRGNAITYQLKPHSGNPHSTNPHSPRRETPFADTSVPIINRNEPSITLDADFESFWDAYPRKVAKGSAKKVWNRLAKQGTLPPVAELITAAKAYGESVSEKRFVAYPATWLNGERWSDNLETKSASVQVTTHNAARSFGAAMRNTGRTEAQLIESIGHYTAAEQQAAIDEYRKAR